MLYLFVALGSALGGVSRYGVGLVLQPRFGSGFPGATLVINVVGSLLLGFLLRASLGSLAVTPEMRALLTTGFCGGFTTFSTFSYDTAALIETGQYGRAATYVTLSVGLSLLATFAGFALAGAALTHRPRS
jgi:CrcB protein